MTGLDLGTATVTLAPGVDRERLEHAIDEHERFRDAPEENERVLASGSRGRTTRVAWDEAGDAVVKETRRAWTDQAPFAAWLGRGRARRAWQAAVRLTEVRVPVAAPLALVEAGPRAFLVARHIAGERLDRALARALEERDVALVARLARASVQLAAALHGAGVAHHDLKPSNVIVEALDTGRLVAIDLDASREGSPSRRARARDLAALDAYGQRGRLRVPRRTRLDAFGAYVARAGLESGDGRALLRAVVERSLWKRARWRRASA